MIKSLQKNINLSLVLMIKKIVGIVGM